MSKRFITIDGALVPWRLCPLHNVEFLYASMCPFCIKERLEAPWSRVIASRYDRA